MSYEDDVDPRSKSKSADELSAKLRELMIVCRENLHHAQELLEFRCHAQLKATPQFGMADIPSLNIVGRLCI